MHGGIAMKEPKAVRTSDWLLIGGLLLLALLLFLFCCLVLDRLEKASLYKKSRKFYNK